MVQKVKLDYQVNQVDKGCKDSLGQKVIPDQQVQKVLKDFQDSEECQEHLENLELMECQETRVIKEIQDYLGSVGHQEKMVCQDHKDIGVKRGI
jgi:hypothetical protein